MIARAAGHDQSEPGAGQGLAEEGAELGVELFGADGMGVWDAAGPGDSLDIERGEAAFYGPKADFVVSDCLGREWQLGTVQLDYNLPSAERFALEYIGADNHPHRPVMIHRAPLGSLERFVGVLIEHFAGAFPLWLAPEQVRVLTVSEKSEAYGREIEHKLRAAGMRVGRWRAASASGVGIDCLGANSSPSLPPLSGIANPGAASGSSVAVGTWRVVSPVTIGLARGLFS